MYITGILMWLTEAAHLLLADTKCTIFAI